MNVEIVGGMETIYEPLVYRCMVSTLPLPALKKLCKNLEVEKL